MPVYCDFVVVSDPDEYGGYPVGARFSPEEMIEMVSRGCITVGTIFRVTNYCSRLRCSKGKYVYRNRELIRIRGSQ